MKTNIEGSVPNGQELAIPQQEQEPIIIGPDTVRRRPAKAKNDEKKDELDGSQKPKRRRRTQQVDFSESDEDSYMGDSGSLASEDNAYFQGQYLAEDYITWDLLIKNGPQLPPLESIISKVQNKDFFKRNQYIQQPPFIIFYRNQQEVIPENLTHSNFLEYIGVPHAHELQTIFEDFHQQRYPKKEICTLKRKFFIVSYTMQVIHAVDGFNNGVLLLPVNGNFLIKVYTQQLGETYFSEIKALLELQSLIMFKEN